MRAAPDVTVAMLLRLDSVFRSKAEKKVVELGYDPARLPPGQYLTEKWPVLHAGGVPKYKDLSTWTLRVFGEVENEVELSWEQFNELPRSSNTQDIHCVTRWSRFDTRFEGVHWRELAKLAQPKSSAHFVIAHAEAGFTSNVPLSFLEDDNALLATHGLGEPLAPDHGYPLRLVIPGKYFWKSAKWLRGIELSSVDKPGFWERYGYNNDADPWKEERYGF
jgi:Sulfite oxidase and related enzymes